MPAFDERTETSSTEKRAIGRLAASLVSDGETVLLDGGTTTLEVARGLVGRRVQVVTNSLPIAQLVAPDPDTDLILLGGYVYPRTGVALGPIAIGCMSGIRVHRVFMGAGGIVADGIYNSNSLLVETEREMMRCGQEVVVVADRTKFGKLALARLCGLEEIGRIVADDGLADEHRALVEKAGVELLLAGGEPSRETINNGARGRQ
jgi:DeoR/GlpR family transcriptional regulator of sugar metabolism